MKNFLRLGIIFLVAVILISLIKPFIENYQEKQKYAFTVDTIDGKISKEDFKGKALAVYFGYTYCPDVCPTSLSSLSQALNSFTEEETKDFVGLFISVDPDRDTLQNLKEYTHYFHKNFIGGTSSKENIDDITKRYESYYKKIPLENSAMGYSVSHTSYIYLFDKEGKFIAKVDHFSDPSKIKENLAAILK
ncbi:SCO family protein [Halarcobacter mediterraneus]|uniref:SCO family protein n=1 Tax=Halarcobacter mediterraneus TaxID=2023153 RepID=A0A4Q1ARJ9_9BACT|nr:SCO family protein [Halarcobacter mediterraneus]RXK11656.1 SCO family protein [Halarcobacter mediterraneus]